MIKIKIISCNLLKHKYEVKVFDECHNLISKGCTDKLYCFDSKINCHYYVTVTQCDGNHQKIIRVLKDRGNNECFIFKFNTTYYKRINTPLTNVFTLTDANYIGLPIERGEINLG